MVSSASARVQVPAREELGLTALYGPGTVSGKKAIICSMPNGKILLVTTADDGAPPFIGNLPVSVCTPGTCPWPLPENLPVLLVVARVGPEMCIHLSRRAKLETPRAIRILYHASKRFFQTWPLMDDHAFTLALPESEPSEELHAILAAVLKRAGDQG